MASLQGIVPIPVAQSLRKRETLHLTQGRIGIDFRDRAHVDVWGPASLSFTSESVIELRGGRITATVSPKGRGFTVETPNARIIDWGTQFGVDVNFAGGTDVVVFRSEVDCMLSPSQSRRLYGGNALRINDSGAPNRIYSVRNFMPHQGWDPILYAWTKAPHMLAEWLEVAEKGTLAGNLRSVAFFAKGKPDEQGSLIRMCF